VPNGTVLLMVLAERKGVFQSLLAVDMVILANEMQNFDNINFRTFSLPLGGCLLHAIIFILSIGNGSNANPLIRECKFRVANKIDLVYYFDPEAKIIALFASLCSIRLLLLLCKEIVSDLLAFVQRHLISHQEVYLPFPVQHQEQKQT
jgi:hypothetical protein